MSLPRESLLSGARAFQEVLASQYPEYVWTVEIPEREETPTSDGTSQTDPKEKP